jgi:hypothetical protein
VSAVRIVSRSSVAKWPDIGATTSSRGCISAPFLREVQQRPERCHAMYAPVVTRLATYHVAQDAACRRYGKTILAMPEMAE